MITVNLKDGTGDFTFDYMEVPVVRKVVEGKSERTTLNGNVFVDFAYGRREWTFEFSWLDLSTYATLRGFYDRQRTSGNLATKATITGLGAFSETSLPVYVSINDAKFADKCGRVDNVRLTLREVDE